MIRERLRSSVSHRPSSDIHALPKRRRCNLPLIPFLVGGKGLSHPDAMKACPGGGKDGALRRGG